MIKNRSVKVVLIEDNDVVRMTLRGIMRSAGFEVAGEGSNGDVAVELVERIAPHLVCLDVMMPGRSGMDVLKELRQKNPKLPVLMITGMSTREMVQEMLVAGASGIVVKPFSAQRVIETARRVLGLG